MAARASAIQRPRIALAASTSDGFNSPVQTASAVPSLEITSVVGVMLNLYFCLTSSGMRATLKVFEPVGQPIEFKYAARFARSSEFIATATT